MAKRYQLAQTLGADMETRFSVEGRRVSRERFETIRDSADRLECLQTVGRQLSGGRFRRTNYSIAVFDHGEPSI